jgi:membrane peptidoglycan carboxypeptidase
MTNVLNGNTDPRQNPWWGQYEIVDGRSRRPATLKTGTSDQTQDLFAMGYVAPPADPNAPAIVAGVWGGNSDNSSGNAVLSLEMAAPLWHAFMSAATAGTPIADFKQPSGIVTKTIDAYSGMLPGPYTTSTWSEVFVKGTEPTQVDNTKVPVDINADTNTLWTPNCTGTKVTKGFLDLSVVDAGNANFQKYDQIWIQRAKKGVGVRGGPNNSPTMYFYSLPGFGFNYTPFGRTWGAAFPPTATCAAGGSPVPSGSGSTGPTASPTPVPSGGSTPVPTATPTARPTHTPPVLPSAVFLAPLALWGLIGKSHMRQGRRLRRIAARGLRSRH